MKFPTVKVPKVILAVAALHVVPMALIFQSGCQSRSVNNEPQIFQAETRPSSDATVASGTPVPLDPAFNAGLGGGVVATRDGSTPRSTPTRPAWDDVNTVDFTSAPLQDNATLRKPLAVEPVRDVQDAEPEVASTATGVAGKSYIIQRGDSLWSIAQRHQVPLDALLSANGLNKNSTIHPGNTLNIPAGGSAAASSGMPPVTRSQAPAVALTGDEDTYIIMPGDTLGKIAKRYGTSVQALQALNGISDPRKIRAGQELIVQGTPRTVVNTPMRSSASSTSQAAPRTASSRDGLVYTVARGDTLGSISKKFGVGIKELMDLNGIDNPRSLRAGQDLLIKREGRSASASSSTLSRQPEARSIVPQNSASQQGTSSGAASAPANDFSFDAFDDIPVVDVQQVE